MTRAASRLMPRRLMPLPLARSRTARRLMPEHAPLFVATLTGLGDVVLVAPSALGRDVRLEDAQAIHVTDGWMWGGGWVAGGLLWVAGGWVVGRVVRGWLVGGLTAPRPLTMKFTYISHTVHEGTPASATNCPNSGRPHYGHLALWR